MKALYPVLFLDRRLFFSKVFKRNGQFMTKLDEVMNHLHI